MAQQALGSGTTVARKRVLFGLLDADGWGWASIKAGIWLVLIIFILGYIPDRAYYFTVNRTVDLGILAWSPVNLCPPENQTLPCPAPVGAVVPWEPSPDSRLDLPAPRTDGAVVQIGTTLFFIGGSDGQAAQADVYITTITGPGNFAEWSAGPALPEPRADASVVFSLGSIYVFGGRDASGAPTSTAFVLTPDAQTGALGEWIEAPEALALLAPRAGAAIAAVPDGLIMVGGSDESGPVATSWKSVIDDRGTLGEWENEAALVRPQTDATAVVIGDHVWLFGGSDDAGPVGAVQRGDIGLAAAEGFPENPDEGKIIGWRIADEVNLPTARTNASSWGANGSLYLVGGRDSSGLQRELYWATPTGDGGLSEWKHLDVSDLPGGLQGAASVLAGSSVILIGGQTDSGTLASSVRANLAPQAPFFQLGLVGATVPALKIDGEIGQQLGYLNAAGVGTVNFALLLILGWAFNHKEQSRALVGRLIRRRRTH